MVKTQTLVGPEFTHSVIEQNLGQFLFNSAEKFGDRICQIDGTNDTSETYTSVKLRSIRAAIEMKKRGLTSNDVISVCSANTLDNTIPMIAAFYLGIIVANLDPTASGRRTKHLLTLVTPKMIFVEEAAVQLIEESLVDTKFQTIIVVFGSSGKYLGFSEFIKPHDGEHKFRPLDDIEAESIALMLFTSGTSGPPKAACHTHRSFIFMVLQTYQFIIRENIFHTVSFYPLSALILLACAFRAGTYRLFYRNPTAENVFTSIEKYKVAYLFTTPYFTYELTKCLTLEQFDISSLQMIMSTGTPMGASHIRKIRDIFPNVMFSFVYGMSELGIVTAFHPKDDPKLAKKKSISVGRPTPGVMLKVVQIGGSEGLSYNQHGEIYLKSPAMMTGFLNQDPLDVFDDAGFLKTGDVGYFDKDQCVYIPGRIKEVFMYQSQHVIPSSLEAVLKEHPAIMDAVVFGIPGTEQDGELPTACVILKEDCELTEKDIDEYLRMQVSDIERLRGGVIFVDFLPETPTGKVARKEIRERYIKDKKSFNKKYAGRHSADRQSDDRRPADRQSAGRQSADRQPADKQFADRKAVDRKATDRQSLDTQPDDKQSADKKSADKKAAGRTAADRQSADRQSTDRQPAEKQS